MPNNPIRASYGGGGGWMRDSSGMMAPVGGGTSAKMLIQLPKEVQEIAASANTLVRGKFSPELWPKLSLLSTLAGPNHLKTKMFIINVAAGSMAENGQASRNFLMGITNMLVPAAMVDGKDLYPHEGGKSRDNHKGKVVEESD